jgi:hypothetical protein
MKAQVFGYWVIACGLAYGQTGSVAGPSSGYVFDPSAKSIRQIRGIPGASLLSDPLDLGISAASVEVAPRGDSAVAVAADTSVHVFGLKDGAATELVATNVAAGPLKIVYSPSGTAAALVSANRVQVLSGLPDSLSVADVAGAVPNARPVEAASANGQRTNAAGVAVSDDGKYLMVSRGQSVSLIGPSGDARVLADAHGPAMLAFAPGGHDAAIVAGGTLSVFQDVAGASTRQDFPNSTASAGLAFSVDGTKVLMAGRRAVTVQDRNTGDRKLVECDCQIGGLRPVGTLFRVNELGSGPLWLLDAAADPPKLWFVPAKSL